MNTSTGISRYSRANYFEVAIHDHQRIQTYPRTNAIAATSALGSTVYRFGDLFHTYSQTSIIRSSFIRIPRHPEENRWLPIYSSCSAYTVCVFDYPVPSPIRNFSWKTDVCGYARSDCIAIILHIRVPVSVCLQFCGTSVQTSTHTHTHTHVSVREHIPKSSPWQRSAAHDRNERRSARRRDSLWGNRSALTAANRPVVTTGVK